MHGRDVVQIRHNQSLKDMSSLQRKEIDEYLVGDRLDKDEKYHGIKRV